MPAITIVLHQQTIIKQQTLSIIDILTKKIKHKNKTITLKNISR